MDDFKEEEQGALAPQAQASEQNPDEQGPAAACLSKSGNLWIRMKAAE